MNGLEENIKTGVEFRKIDANSKDGQAIFRSYKLRGHPSYVILNPEAKVLWIGLGEQTMDLLAYQINVALGE